MKTSMFQRRFSIPKMAVLGLLPFSLLAYFQVTYPFADTLAVKQFSLKDLSPQQRSNIQIAAGKLDGFVLKPQEEFSFNRIVGPRTENRGYRAAPSYLETGSPATVGGGICLLSSGIYQLALQSGCPVTARTAHTRTIRSVQPGLDSTVWYDRVDLRFKNPYPGPVRLQLSCTDSHLKVSLTGRESASVQRGRPRTLITSRNGREIVVEVVRQTSEKQEFISRDHYLTTPSTYLR